MLAETWSVDSDTFAMNEYTTIHRTNCPSGIRKAFGTMIFIKNSLLTYANVFFEKQVVATNGNITVVGLAIASQTIIFIHKSPQASVKNFLDILEEAIVISKSANQITIVGDFNIKYQAGDTNYNKLNAFMTTHKFYFSLKENDVSTDNQSLIDLCFSSKMNFEAHLFESVTSDHKPVWFTLN
jgi:hypothetical protein